MAEPGLSKVLTEYYPPTANITAGGVAGVSVDKQDDVPAILRKVTIQLAAASVAIAESEDYGSILLVDLPDTNMRVYSVEIDLELVKAETENGLIDTTDLTVGLGSAAASNATLSGTMIDRQEVTALTATDASPAWQDHSAANGTLAVPYEIADAATSKIYLNAAASIAADDTFTATGTITIIYLDLGNVTS